jgi:hypothetical protein
MSTAGRLDACNMTREVREEEDGKHVGEEEQTEEGCVQRPEWTTRHQRPTRHAPELEQTPLMDVLVTCHVLPPPPLPLLPPRR